MLIDFNPAYFDSCVNIYYDMFTSPDWGFDWLTIENARRYFKDVSDSPRFKGYIYLNGGEAAGCCLGEISDYFCTAQYTIKEIYIDPALQGKGHGSGFLSEIEADLKKYGIDNILLSTSRSVKAYNFYIKNGFIVSPETVFLVKFLNTDSRT